MPNMLTRKLELFGPLDVDDKAVLDRVVSRPRSVAARSNIISEGDNPEDVHLIIEGLACRSKVTAEGLRTIFAFLIPGDFCDLNIFILKAMDHNIEAISQSLVVDIPRKTILELTGRPAIARALWWATLVDEATLREWLVNLGQRDALERMAHLFCELHLRMKSVGLTTDGHFSLPLTQTELGEALGITSVHTNRVLQALRDRGLIEFHAKQTVIPDVQRLRSVCDFNPNYLHLDGGKPEVSFNG